MEGREEGKDYRGRGRGKGRERENGEGRRKGEVGGRALLACWGIDAPGRKGCGRVVGQLRTAVLQQFQDDPEIHVDLMSSERN